MINIDILKPQCRIDDLWVRVITKNDVDLPLAQSRLELYVTALITGNIDNLPYPQSRVEMLLYCILTDTEYTFNAQSRVEMFLKTILTLDIEGLPTPMSRLEWYLDYIVRNGCLEKYEYYPFNILSYLNVKNTPKAKMKFKSMKGNTLVNVVKVSPSSLIELIYPLTKGKIYTWILEFDSNMDCYCMLEESTSWAKLSDTYSVKAGHNFLIIKGLSIPYNYVGTYNISLTNRVNGEYSPYVKFTNRKVTAVEGDWTNCLSSHIEGMKSFGESENKIEVLSDNNLQGELNQSSKATLMYRNSSNELVPIPILRGKWEGDRFLWGDEILEHEDGKLYYHKRFEYILLTGSEEKGWSINGVSKFLEFILPHKARDDYKLINDRLKWLALAATNPTNPIGIGSTAHNAVRIKPFEKHDMTLEEGLNWVKSNNISLVYQLDQEEVYQCELSEQLYSYDNETNIFINGGAVVGETTIEIGTKLGPIVAEIKQETLRNTKAVEGLLSHGVQEMAYQLYPEDFNKSIETVPTESVE